MNEESKLYKVLKVKMKDFERHEEIVVTKTGKEKRNKKGEIVKKIVTDNIIKIVIKDVEYTDKNEEKKVFQATSINHKDVKRYYTLLKDSETIRIVRALDFQNNNSQLEKNDYIFIKDIITADVKVETYKNDTKGTIVLSYQQVDKEGQVKKDDNGEPLIKNVTYVRLMASSGNIRSKKVTFIREDLFSEANEILLGGLPSDMEYPRMSKFNTYYALPSTDSMPVTMPKIVVINDYEKGITETFDVVRPKKDEKGNKIKDEYTCKPEERTEVIKPFDGAGIVDISIAKVWASELGLYKEDKIINEEGIEEITKTGYIPSYFQFRVIPGIKGDLYVMDLKKYAIDYKIRTGNQAFIKDAYDNDIEILDKNGELLKNAILTKSQFKFYSKYKEMWGNEGFSKWQEFFSMEVNGYKKTFNIAKYGVNFKDIKDEVLLSYQPLQTLNFNNVQIKKLCEPTIEKIKLISTNVDEFLKFRGLVDEFKSEHNKKENTLVPQYYMALKDNKALWSDKFIQSKVKEDIKGFKERSYKGGIIAKGNYQVLIPDIVGLVQFAFGEEVIGCLKANEVYSRYWIKRNQNKIDIIRFPHIAMEHRVVNVVQPKFEKTKNWLKYISEGIVTSMYDTNVLAANSADFDGDRICTISTHEIMQQVEEEKANTITYVPEVDKKDNEENKDIPRINNMDKIIATDVMGMSNDIGSVVNKISQLWSIIPKDDREKDNIQEMIKIMSVIGSLTIDFVKTGIKSPIPPSILKFLSDNNVKKPDFMKWKYKKIAKEERAINRNKRLMDKKEIELFGNTECTVNKISWYMQDMVKDIELETDNNITFDFSKLYSEFNKRAEGYIVTLDAMLELKKEEDKIGYQQNKDSDDFVDSDDNTEQYMIFYKYAKNKLMRIVADKKYKLDKEKMLDYLIYIVTNEKAFTGYNNMNLLWNTWGSELSRRINGKKLITKKLDEEKLRKRIDKAKIKIEKRNVAKEKVYINIFMVNDDKKEVTIFDDEIDAIKNTIPNNENKRLALTLLVLDKFCKAYKKDFNIANNKKSIKMYNIYRLADINHKKIEGHLKELKESKVIELHEKDNGKSLECLVNINAKKEKKLVTINDVNQVKKLFKLIA